MNRRYGSLAREGSMPEGLITLEQFEQIQNRIEEGARAPARKNISADFILRGHVACADCGKPLTGYWAKSKTGKKYPYYECFNKECGSYRKSIKRDQLEAEFGAMLKRLNPTQRGFSIASAMFKRAWDVRLAQAKQMAAALKDDVKRLDKQIEQLVDRIVHASSETAVTAYERRIAKLERDKHLAAEKLAGTPGPQRGFNEMFELACAFLSKPWKIWQNGDEAAKRTVMRLVFSERPAYCRNQGFRTPKTTIPFKLLGEIDMLKCGMAEREGFEPPIELPLYRISSAALSTTQPPLRTRCRAL